MVGSPYKVAAPAALNVGKVNGDILVTVGRNLLVMHTSRVEKLMEDVSMTAPRTNIDVVNGSRGRRSNVCATAAPDTKIHGTISWSRRYQIVGVLLSVLFSWHHLDITSHATSHIMLYNNLLHFTPSPNISP